MKYNSIKRSLYCIDGVLCWSLLHSTIHDKVLKINFIKKQKSISKDQNIIKIYFYVIF